VSTKDLTVLLKDLLALLLRSDKRIGVIVLAGLCVVAAAAMASRLLPNIQSGVLSGGYIVLFGLLASVLSYIANDQTLGRLLASVVAAALVVGLIGLIATFVLGLPRESLPAIFLGLILVVILPASAIYLGGKLLSTVVPVPSIALGFGLWCVLLLVCFICEPMVKHYWPPQIVDRLTSEFGSAFAVACYILISASVLTGASSFIGCCLLLAFNSWPDRNDRRDKIIISVSGNDHP
jgi:hypothetical protein